MAHRRLPVILVLFSLVFASLACTLGSKPASDQPILTILASPELASLAPLFGEIEASTGLKLDVSYAPTVEASARLAQGEKVDLAWLSTDRYLLMLQDEHSRVMASEQTLRSPVLLAVKELKAKQFGWLSNPLVSWNEIADKAASGDLRFALPNPATSNAGFAALLSAATVLSGQPAALQSGDVEKAADRLRGFIDGQQLTAADGRELAQKFAEQESTLDGIIDYEALLLQLNSGGSLKESLVLIYPQEGAFNADFPLFLVNEGRRAQFDTLVAYLRSPKFQREVMMQYAFRPVDPQVALSADFPAQMLLDIPFPANKAVVDLLLARYKDELKGFSNVIYVLDVSKNMSGAHLDAVKAAFKDMTGGGGTFAGLGDRENVSIIAYNHKVSDPVSFKVDLSHPETLLKIRQYVDGLTASGNTATFDALQAAYSAAQASLSLDPARPVKVVLVTDGQRQYGDTLDDFTTFLQAHPELSAVHTYAVGMGEAKVDELQKIADATGGQVFDANTQTLASIFQAIEAIH